MVKGFYTDKISRPSLDQFKEILGASTGAWESLCGYLSDDLHLKGELKFYGINYGWALRFTKTGRSVIALYPNKGFLTVQIILNDSQVGKALSCGLDPEIEGIINGTESIHEGKWLYIKVEGSTFIESVRKLIDIRIHVK